MKKPLILAIILLLTLSLVTFGIIYFVKDGNDTDNDNQSNSGNNSDVTKNDDLSTKPASIGLEFDLSTDGKSYVLTGLGSCADTDIIIPSSYNGLPVSAIKETFLYNSPVIGTVLITEADDSVKISKKRIFIPHSITSFIDSSDNTTASIPFDNVKEFQVDTNNAAYTSIDGNLYSKDAKTLISYASAKKDLSFVIPDSVTTVEGKAFYQTNNLVSLTIGTGVTKFANLTLDTPSTPPIFTPGGSISDSVVIKPGTDILNSNSQVKKLVEIYNKSKLTINDYTKNYMSLSSDILNIYSDTDGQKKTFKNADGYLFYEDGDTCYLMGYDGNANAITLPQSCNSKRYDIYKYAFYNNSDIISLTISSGVDTIGESAFGCCYELKNVTILDGVKKISDYVFDSCLELEKITLPNSLKEIKNCGFYSCEKLTYNKYENAYYLGNESNPYLVLVKTEETNSNTFTTNANTKFIAPSSLDLVTAKNFIIPDSVEYIGDYTFASYSIATITIGKNVSYIDSNAFLCAYILEIYNRSALDVSKYFDSDSQKVYNIYSDTEGEKKTFEDPNGFLFYHSSDACYLYGYNGDDEIVTLPESCNDSEYELYINAFSGNKKIKKLTIPDTVKSISEYAFSGCINLTEVTIPQSVTDIGSNAFEGCAALTNISIPNSVTSIGNCTFLQCVSLTSISVAEDNLNYTSIDGHLYSKDGKTFIQYAMGKTNETFTIPESVTKIENYAFMYCTALKSVTIGSCVTEIGYYAFFGCSSLESIVIPESVTKIDYFAFVECTNLGSVTFEDPNGWKLNSWFQQNVKVFSSEFISDTAKAAELVKSLSGFYEYLTKD